MSASDVMLQELLRRDIYKLEDAVRDLEERIERLEKKSTTAHKEFLAYLHKSILDELSRRIVAQYMPPCPDGLMPPLKTLDDYDLREYPPGTTFGLSKEMLAMEKHPATIRLEEECQSLFEARMETFKAIVMGWKLPE